MRHLIQGRCDRCRRRNFLTMHGSIADHQWLCDGCIEVAEHQRRCVSIEQAERQGRLAEIQENMDRNGGRYIVGMEFTLPKQRSTMVAWECD